MEKWIIFDLDGTLADIKARRSLAAKENGKLDWKVFFNPDNIKLDVPMSDSIALYIALQRAGYKMAIFSGRGEETKEVTESWLKDNGISYDILRMRPVSNYEPDDSLKRDWLKEEFEYRNNQWVKRKKWASLLCVFDDRNKVVDMWRSEGILCCQVAPGDF